MVNVGSVENGDARADNVRCSPKEWAKIRNRMHLYQH